ncbi:hypothetical protein OQA88_13292 [Cercophora sp. LCS_1]
MERIVAVVQRALDHFGRTSYFADLMRSLRQVGGYSDLVTISLWPEVPSRRRNSSTITTPGSTVIEPIHEELDAFAAYLPRERRRPDKCTKQFWDKSRLKAHFSAAAAAIHFLGSLPLSVRCHLRRVVVHEDRFAVSNPESHVRGLAPFCRENAELRIKCRLDLWRNCFENDGGSSFPLSIPGWLGQSHARLATRRHLRGINISRCFMLWVAELHLAEIPEAITLALDADPIASHTSHIFQGAVAGNVAWGGAFRRARGIWPQFWPNYLDRGQSHRTPMREFTKRFKGWAHGPTLSDIVSDLRSPAANSRVSCNFEPGRPLDDVEIVKLLAESPNSVEDIMNRESWYPGREAPYGRHSCDTVSPLPSFGALREEYLLPDEPTE